MAAEHLNEVAALELPREPLDQVLLVPLGGRLAEDLLPADAQLGDRQVGQGDDLGGDALLGHHDSFAAFWPVSLKNTGPLIW